MWYWEGAVTRMVPMNDLEKVLPIAEIYRDLAQPAVREVGDALGNAAKVARFFAAPIDYIAAYQNRWQSYLKRIAERVPEERRCVAIPQVVGPAIESLRFLEEDGLLAEMFVNLLSRAIDKDRVGEAHPAFSTIIGQLSPDEAVMIWHLRKGQYAVRQSAQYFPETNTFAPRVTEQNDFPLADLVFPQNFWLYADHLHSLNISGIWQQGNQEIVRDGAGKQTGVNIHSKAMLTPFGTMLADACMPADLQENWRAVKPAP